MDGSHHIESALLTWAQKQPAVTSIMDLESGTSLTYVELYQAIRKLRGYLGVDPKTILIALPSGIPTSVLWLATLSGGHQLIPISPDATDYEMEQILAQHAPDLVITSETVAPYMTEVAKTTPTLDRPRDGTVYLTTSGSTGRPKGIILTASQCVLTAQNIIASHQLTNRDRALTPLPFYHVNAPVVSLLTTILSGGSLGVAPRYSTERFWEWVSFFQPTWISIVPTMAAMLLSTERPSFLDDNKPRFVRTASAPLSKTTLQAFETKFRLPLVETYGITEAASTITANPVPPGIHKPGSVGLPIGISLQIYDPLHHRPAESGEVGEVHIKGENVIAAYVDNRDEASFRDGWFITGDLGYMDADGYLFLTGRTKDIIIRGGENIFPREIEEVLSSFAGIREAVAVGQPDPLYGEKVVAYLTTDDSVSRPSEDDLSTFVLRHLSKQKVPITFHFVDDFPRTKAGKIDKPLLRRSESRNSRRDVKH